MNTGIIIPVLVKIKLYPCAAKAAQGYFMTQGENVGTGVLDGPALKGSLF